MKREKERERERESDLVTSLRECVQHGRVSRTSDVNGVCVYAVRLGLGFSQLSEEGGLGRQLGLFLVACKLLLTFISDN